MGSGRRSRQEMRELQRVARRFLRQAPRPEPGESKTRYLQRHEQWVRDVDSRAQSRGLDVDALWECLDELANEQTNAMVSPADIVAAEADGYVPPVDFSIRAARAIFDAGYRNPDVFLVIAGRYLDISLRFDRQPVVRWAVGGQSVLAWRRPGRVEVDLWLEGEREKPAEVDDGELPSDGGHEVVMIVKAADVVRTMPDLPRPNDPSSAQAVKVAQYRKWIEQVRHQVRGDNELSNHVLEAMNERMGLNDPDPVQAAENARELLAAGMGEVGLSRRAAEAMQRQAVNPSIKAKLLVEEYIQTWTNRNFEENLVYEIGEVMCCVGERDALTVNVWLCDEPGMPSVSSGESDTGERRW